MLSRRVCLLMLLPLLAAQAPAPRHNAGDAVLRHRGYSIDMTAVADLQNYSAIADAMRRQIDITADCGAKPAIMAFFLKQRIAAVRGTGKGGGMYARARGVVIDSEPLPPPNNPVLLHELIHALHDQYMPQGNANPDIERFYRIAKDNALYPQANYMMSNRNEYFAVSGSLYLWGVIARPPHTRDVLRQKQPVYYAWLADVFGVKK